MLSRNPLAAVFALAVAVAIPAQSRADITIDIQEGTLVGGVFQSIGAPSIYNGNTFSTTSYTINGGSSGTGASLQSSSNLPLLGTTLNLGITSGFVSGDVLQISVTATGVANSTPGVSATLTNTASSSVISTANSSFTVSSISSVVDPSTNTTLATTGSSIATATYPGASAGGSTLSSPISSLPGTYTVTQTILAYYTPTSSGNPGSATINGTIDSGVVPSIVSTPAPGGLALGLIGLPLVGLRRVLRRKAAVA